MKERILEKIEKWTDIGKILNYTSNYGEVFSLVSRYGKVDDMNECNSQCKSKNLFAFELTDLYNYADSLNFTDFLTQKKTEDKMQGEFCFWYRRWDPVGLYSIDYTV